MIDTVIPAGYRVRMARPRLKSIRFLKNHGVRVVYGTSTTPARARFERPNGHLSAYEAARLLGLRPLQVYRLARANRLPMRPRRMGSRRVPVGVCRLLMALPRRERCSVRAVNLKPRS